MFSAPSLAVHVPVHPLCCGSLARAQPPDGMRDACDAVAAGHSVLCGARDHGGIIEGNTISATVALLRRPDTFRQRDPYKQKALFPGPFITGF